MPLAPIKVKLQDASKFSLNSRSITKFRYLLRNLKTVVQRNSKIPRELRKDFKCRDQCRNSRCSQFRLRYILDYNGAETIPAEVMRILS